jgi:hypothetical protein
VVIQALARFESPELLHRVLEASLLPEFPSAQRRTLYRRMFAGPATRAAAYGWLAQHLDRMQEQVSEPVLTQLFWILPELCREEWLRPAVKLFEPHARGSPERWVPLRQARRAAEQCAAVASRQAPLAERWLRSPSSAAHH